MKQFTVSRSFILRWSVLKLVGSLVKMADNNRQRMFCILLLLAVCFLAKKNVLRITLRLWFLDFTSKTCSSHLGEANTRLCKLFQVERKESKSRGCFAL